MKSDFAINKINSKILQWKVDVKEWKRQQENKDSWLPKCSNVVCDKDTKEEIHFECYVLLPT